MYYKTEAENLQDHYLWMEFFFFFVNSYIYTFILHSTMNVYQLACTHGTAYNSVEENDAHIQYVTLAEVSSHCESTASENACTFFFINNTPYFQ